LLIIANFGKIFQEFKKNMTNSSIAKTSIEEINTNIHRLRQLTEIDVIQNWRYQLGDLINENLNNIDNYNDWQPVSINEKNQILWEKGRKTIWLGQKFVIPEQLNGYSVEKLCLRLCLTWWAELAEIFVNGELVQTGDLFDSSSRIILSLSAIPGQEIFITIKLITPYHDQGALMQSLSIYEDVDNDFSNPSFVADELQILTNYLEFFLDQNKEDDQVFNTLFLSLQYLEKQLNLFNWDLVGDRPKFAEQLTNLRENIIKNIIEKLPDQIPHINQLTVNLLGHAHLDLAWLWPISETWQVAEKTFQSVLNLQKDFPDLTYTHSTPVLYAWLEENRPALFQEIQTKILANKWHIDGGLWVEPDLNLLGVESIVRQILYGQKYVKEKFGKYAQVAWLPDTFGFSTQLPQLFQQGEIKYFVTQKLRWNDTNKFLYDLFIWQSPDGSEITSYMSAPIGEKFTPIKVMNYLYEWYEKTGIKEALWLIGVGDHGGGPTRDMLEIINRWQKSPFFPPVEFTNVTDYLDEITANFTQNNSYLGNQVQTAEINDNLGKNNQVNSQKLPQWQDEIYLEFHRGCYTTHADQKLSNRQCENLLYQAELWSSIATIKTGVNYPQALLTETWQKVLFNQFHDILPGTSIHEVYQEANKNWLVSLQVSQEILEQAIHNITNQIDLSLPDNLSDFDWVQPIIIFNSLNWERSQVISVDLPTNLAQEINWQVFNHLGEKVLSEISLNSEQFPILFLADQIPAIGYCLYWLVGNQQNNINQEKVIKNLYEPVKYWTKESGNHVLQNQFLIVEVEAKTGDIIRIFDQINQREILAKNQSHKLLFFQDQGQYWDGWNIDPKYEDYPLQDASLVSINIGDQGILKASVKVEKKFCNSLFIQEYLLEIDSPVLVIKNQVDWQENHVLVKAHLPVNFQADYVTYEIPGGVINRTTKPANKFDEAKWEVPALRWANINSNDLTNSYGVSLINDCKYGYSAKLNQLNLTLLRGSIWPDELADRGKHQFTYGIYPHNSDWKNSKTVQFAHQLNIPLQMLGSPLTPLNKGGKELKRVSLLSNFETSEEYSFNSIDSIDQKLPPIYSFFNWSNELIILTALKQSESDPNKWILRLCEMAMENQEWQWSNNLGLNIEDQVNLLESSINSEIANFNLPINIKPAKIISFILSC
jgi:alpha-mannosidase